MSFLNKVAADVCEGLCTPDGTGLPNVAAKRPQVTIVLQLIFATIGAIALFNIILAGIRMSTSIGSDPQAFSKARGTIIYAGIGLALAMSAEYIVTFVLNKM